MSDQPELSVSYRVLDDGSVQVEATIEVVMGQHQPGDRLTFTGSTWLTGRDWEALLKRAEAQNRVAYQRDAVVQSVRPTTLLKVRDDGQIELSVRAELGLDATLYEGERLTLTDVLSADEWDELVGIAATERRRNHE